MKFSIRRKFPRRDYEQEVGVLVSGGYSVLKSHTISEGGMEFTSDQQLPIGQVVLLNMQLPESEFMIFRAVIRNSQPSKIENGLISYGVEFINFPFHLRRIIRSFIAHLDIRS